MNSSSSSVPILVHGVGMVLGGAIVGLVMLGAVLITAVVTQRVTGRANFLSRHLDASKMVLPAVGALILGSVSGGVAWSSTLYTPAKVAEPQKVVAAYKNIKPVETEKITTAEEAPKNGKSVDSIEIVKNIFGAKFEEINEEFNLDGKGDNTYSNFVDMEYVPDASGQDKADPCYKIKLTYWGVGSRPGAQMGKKSSWIVHPEFDSATCGGDAKEF